MENESSNIIPTDEILNVVKYDTENIKNLIYCIRGKQVMLDSDVAMLYHYETKYINLAVRRNKERFPEQFCFQLTESELENLRLQITTAIENAEGKSRWLQFATALEKDKFRNKKHLPYAFTEQGIAMLSGLLRNDIAVQVSINIMNAFVEMRKFIANNSNMFNRLTTVEYKLLEHDKKFDEVFNALQRREQEQITQKIFFKGQIYDAYSLIIDIIKQAKEKIVIIDNYIDDSILKMLVKKNKNVEVVILTSPNCNITKLDIQKFNKEYPTLKISRTNQFHDRFIIIDNEGIYNCGASLKDLGKKCFAINKMEDISLLEKLDKII